MGRSWSTGTIPELRARASSRLTATCKVLEQERERPWEVLLDRAQKLEHSTRPEERRRVARQPEPPRGWSHTRRIRGPPPGHATGVSGDLSRPPTCCSRIGQARCAPATRFGVKAVEMEGVRRGGRSLAARGRLPGGARDVRLLRRTQGRGVAGVRGGDRGRLCAGAPPGRCGVRRRKLPVHDRGPFGSPSASACSQRPASRDGSSCVGLRRISSASLAMRPRRGLGPVHGPYANTPAPGRTASSARRVT